MLRRPTIAGSCRRCLTICPAKAFPAPYTLDSRRCIALSHDRASGPYRRRTAPGHRQPGLRLRRLSRGLPLEQVCGGGAWLRLALHEGLDGLPLAQLAALDDAAFRTLFAGTPVKRTGRDRFIRNVLIAIGNSGRPELAPSAELLGDASPLVRAMAVWALGRIAPARAVALAPVRLATESDADVRREWLFLSLPRNVPSPR